MAPLPMPARRSRARVLFGITAAATTLIAVTAVNAMTAKGSRDYSQAAAGVSGSVEPGDFFAFAVATGDFDGDDNDDVIAGAPYEDFRGKKRDAGVVHVLPGSRDGLDVGGDVAIHEGTPSVRGKVERDDLFGSAVASGDFDGDGNDDAVVGIPGEDVGSKVDAGGVLVLYGSRTGLRGTGSRTYTQATRSVAGDAERYGYFGASLAVGDFDRDGYDDVAIGAPGSGGPRQDSAGLVHIMYGSGRGITASRDHVIDQGSAGVDGDREAGDEMGASLAAGDFDGDGRDDLAVGVPGEPSAGRPAAGAVQVFSGSKAGLRSSATTWFQGSRGTPGAPEADDLFGAALAAGDFDGDGRDDLAVGTPGQAAGSKVAAGTVQVLYGTRNGLGPKGASSIGQASKGIASSPEAGDEMGLSLVAADLDDDGRDDLAIGAPGERLKSRTGAGVAHVVFGTRSGLSGARHQWFWPGHGGVAGTSQANAGFGRALAAGDIDGDGRADLVGSSPGQAVRGEPTAGALILIFG